MRVLQINSVCGIGSTGRIATDIHAILKEQGHDSYVAFGRGNPINCDNAIRIGNKFDSYAHVVKTRILDKHGFGSKRATKEFVAKVKKLNPDVVHLHNIHGYYINIEILFEYLKEANKPVIWTLHDCWAFTGHCSHFDYIGCSKWEKQCYECPQRHDYPASKLIDNSKANFLTKRNLFSGIKNLTIVTPSKWLARMVKKSYLGDYPVRVIYNGIDLKKFRPKKSDFRKRFDIESKYIILGVASHWGMRKGLNYFKELAKRLNDDFQIVLVGVQDKDIKEIPKNIIGIKKIDSKSSLAELYSTSDIYVNTSVEETMGLTTVEAMACGTPVVVFDATAIPEVVDEKCGVIIKNRGLDQLIEAIFYLKDNNFNTFEHCTNNAKKYANEITYENYIKLYKESYLKRQQLDKGDI